MSNRESHIKLVQSKNKGFLILIYNHLPCRTVVRQKCLLSFRDRIRTLGSLHFRQHWQDRRNCFCRNCKFYLQPYQDMRTGQSFCRTRILSKYILNKADLTVFPMKGSPPRSSHPQGTHVKSVPSAFGCS